MEVMYVLIWNQNDHRENHHSRSIEIIPEIFLEITLEINLELIQGNILTRD